MTEPTPEQRAKAFQKARTFAQAFTDWVEQESGIDFWSECNGEDELEERLANEFATLIAERDAARQAHERLREVAEEWIVTEIRVPPGAYHCGLCNVVCDDIDIPFPHAPDCPLAPLEEKP